MRRLLIAAVSALSMGCVIGGWKPGDLDGDGFTSENGDCWDSMGSPEGSDLPGSSIHPDALEKWYDGIDQDCAGDDDYDADHDGYVWSDMADRSTLGLPPSDLPGGDCWDDPVSIPAGFYVVEGENILGNPLAWSQMVAMDVHPGAAEIWYDGVDQDCTAFADDQNITWDAVLVSEFDQDGDGFLSADYPHWQEASPAEYDFGDDCIDDPNTGSGLAAPNGADTPAAEVSPGAVETWYDGTDQDCDSNDGDQDGDAFWAWDYEDRVTSQGGEPLAIPNPGDCWDDPLEEGHDALNDLPDLTADRVYPGNPVDAWYDGVDQDCAGNDDMDADSDGHGSSYHLDEEGTAGDDCFDSVDFIYPLAPDEDPTDVFPGALESCNEADDDCDGRIDEGDPVDAPVWYLDADGDGFGDAARTSRACDAPAGFVADGDDCDDSDQDVNPSSSERCGGGDEDCDGLVDDQDSDPADALPWFQDADGDTFGNPLVVAFACVAPKGYVSDLTDCDDTRVETHPLVPEVCGFGDDNCDGLVDDQDPQVMGTTYSYADTDGDGFGDFRSVWDSCVVPAGYVANIGDCDDLRADVNPLGVEVCDPLDTDEDCDGMVNADDPDATGTVLYHRDFDGDGFGNPLTLLEACAAPSGYVTDETDCDDTAASTFPGASELCDGVDQDCDAWVDEGVLTTFYADEDSDAFGSAATSVESCTAPTGYVSDATDCDDSVATTWPGALEVCNGRDDDCDAGVDEGVIPDFFRDFDGDGFGDQTDLVSLCTAPSGYVTDSTDCDDASYTIHPGATEVCNLVDEDCDGSVDEGTLLTFYRDNDRDGFGQTAATATTCVAPSGFVAQPNDCDDANAAINPENAETCNGVDDDCDTLVDDGVMSTFWLDHDADGFGHSTSPVQACTQPVGYIDNGNDCNDIVFLINPSGTEICNAQDDDCDGSVDENVRTTFYQDGDGDSFGNLTSVVQTCTVPAGYVVNSTDCNDAVATIFPGATETCNLMDDDCDNQVDEGVQSTWYRDSDSDTYGSASPTILACSLPSGYSSVATDCNDSVTSIHPNAVETCNLLDDDCDNQVDEGALLTFYRDADGDGYGVSTSTMMACTAPSGYASSSSDCNDANAAIRPGATEICNLVDDDCDNVVDENVRLTWYRDFDGDGYGALASPTQACTAPTGYVGNATDCNDASSAIRPGATEICNGIDDDCDGQTDEGVLPTWYRDNDVDGYGSPSVTSAACSQPPGYVANNTDCQDYNATINPSRPEVCDGVDNNCDSLQDNGSVCPSNCPVQYYNGVPYMFCVMLTQWTNARSFCYNYGYDMLTINDANENNWATLVAATLTGYYPGYYWWIGLNDQTTEGTFVWEDGSSATYRNWGLGEPNNNANGGEDCTQLLTWAAWNDADCNVLGQVICEAD